MKTELIKIAQGLSQGVITENEARTLLLGLLGVSDCQFEAYARFCIECDRQGLKPVKHEDYLKLK